MYIISKKLSDIIQQYYIQKNYIYFNYSCDENQGNPLVCGGLELEGDNGGVVSALTLEVESVVGSALPELGPDILGTSVDNINSLLQVWIKL